MTIVIDLIELHILNSPKCAGAKLVQKHVLLTGTKYVKCSKCGERL